MKKRLISLVLVLVLVCLSSNVIFSESVPDFPCAFWGTVTLNGSPSPSGTIIEAKGNGVLNGITGNPITTGQYGQYGDENGLSSKLIVQGDIVDGTEISFWVNGVRAEQSVTWPADPVNRLDLSVQNSTSASSGGGGGFGSSTSFLYLKGWADGSSIEVSRQGMIQKECELKTPDGHVSLRLGKNTRLLTSSDTVPGSLTVSALDSPLASPEEWILVRAFSLGPDGIRFDPDLTLSVSYGTLDLPDNVNPSDMFIAFYDDSQWQSLLSLVDMDANIVRTQISHFSDYALVAKPITIPAETSPVSPVILSPFSSTTATERPTGSTITTTASVSKSNVQNDILMETDVTETATSTPEQSAKSRSPYWIWLSGLVVIAVFGFIVVQIRRKSKK